MISTTHLRKYLQGKDRNARRLHLPTQNRLCILSRSNACAAAQIRKSMEHTCTHRLQIQSQARKNDKILRAAEKSRKGVNQAGERRGSGFRRVGLGVSGVLVTYDTGGG